jgi:hypothetical protein
MARDHSRDSILDRAKLVIGQHHQEPVSGTRGSGWYDAEGRRIGWGDLTNPELERIAGSLRDDELFLVLHVEDAFYKFLRILVPDVSRRTPDEDRPGLDHIARNALFVIRKGRIHRVHNLCLTHGEERHGILYATIDREAARRMISEDTTLVAEIR